MPRSRSTAGRRSGPRRSSVSSSSGTSNLDDVQHHWTASRAVSTDILQLPARVVVPRTGSRRRTARNVLEELSGVSERPMIIPMATTGRLQQRYDHRLRDLVQGTGDVTIATDLGVPRSTARGWLGKAPKVVVSLDVTNLKASELQQEVLELRRRVKKLTALPRLALAPASKLRIHVDARASARRTRQNQDPASRGSCP